MKCEDLSGLGRRASNKAGDLLDLDLCLVMMYLFSSFMNALFISFSRLPLLLPPPSPHNLPVVPSSVQRPLDLRLHRDVCFPVNVNPYVHFRPDILLGADGSFQIVVLFTDRGRDSASNKTSSKIFDRQLTFVSPDLQGKHDDWTQHRWICNSQLYRVPTCPPSTFTIFKTLFAPSTTFPSRSRLHGTHEEKLISVIELLEGIFMGPGVFLHINGT